GPDELAVGLFATDVVIALFASFGLFVGPSELDLCLVGFAQDVLNVVLHQRDLGEGRSANQFDCDRRRFTGRNVVAHHVRFAAGGAAVVGNDIVGGRIS